MEVDVESCLWCRRTLSRTLLWEISRYSWLDGGLPSNYEAESRRIVAVKRYEGHSRGRYISIFISVHY